MNYDKMFKNIRDNNFKIEDVRNFLECDLEGSGGNILELLDYMKKFDEIYTLSKSTIILLKNYNFYIKFCIKRKNLEMLEYLCNDEIFDNLEIKEAFYNPDAKITKLIFYRKNKINIDLILLNPILERCDLFDQFLTYKPDSLMISKLVKRAHYNEINIDNWLKIISDFPDCFSFIEDRKLFLFSDESLYIHLFSIGYGQKIDPDFLSVQFILDNWFYLDMDNYFKTCKKIPYWSSNVFNVLIRSPKFLIVICDNIANKSKNKRCFDKHKDGLKNVFTKMKEEDKNIFRELLKASPLNESCRKFLSNRSYKFKNKENA